jgi:hypothetical protein
VPVLIAQLFLLTSLASVAKAEVCLGPCDGMVRSLQEKTEKLQRTQVILQKNEDYMKKNPEASPSIAIKVRSNILVSKIQIETLQNEKVLIEKTISEKGCGQCQPSPTKGT